MPSASGVSAGYQHDFDLAISYFYEFIRRFAEELLDEYTDSTNLSPLQRLVRHVRGRTREMDDLVQSICEIADIQPLHALPKAVEVTDANEGTQSNNSKIEAGIDGKFEELKVGGSLSAANAAEFGESQKDSYTSKTDYVFEASRRYQPVSYTHLTLPTTPYV